MLTPLQFLVIKAIINEKLLGPDIRNQLLKDKYRISTSAFYQLMDRMEKLKYVEQIYYQKTSYLISQYSVTELGVKELIKTKDFYCSHNHNSI